MGDIQSVGAGELIDPQQRGGFVVIAGRPEIALRSQLDAGHVPQAHGGAVTIPAQDDLFESGDAVEAGLGDQGVLEATLAAQGRIPHLAQSRLETLASQGVGDVVDRQPQEAQFVGVDPDPQGVAPLPQVLHIAYAWDTFELLDDVQRGEVGEVEAVVFGIGGADRDDLHHIGRNLPGGDAGLFDRFGQGRQGPGDAVLYIHGGSVQVVARLEGDGDDRRAVRGGDRGAVERPLHPAQLLLDGASDRLFDH